MGKRKYPVFTAKDMFEAVPMDWSSGWHLPYASEISGIYWRWKHQQTANQLRAHIKVAASWATKYKNVIPIDDIDAVRWAWDKPLSYDPTRAWRQEFKDGKYTEKLLREELIRYMFTKPDFDAYYSAMNVVDNEVDKELPINIASIVSLYETRS